MEKTQTIFVFEMTKTNHKTGGVVEYKYLPFPSYAEAAAYEQQMARAIDEGIRLRVIHDNGFYINTDNYRVQFNIVKFKRAEQ